MPIKAILMCWNSRRDKNGNCYYAFTFTDCASGISVNGTISGGESNVSGIVRQMGLDWQSCKYIRTELPISKYDRMVKTWDYAGCTPDELTAYIAREDQKQQK